MNKGKKGQFQYISQEKKRRLIKTILFFLGPIIVYVTGVIITKSNATLFTVFAILLALPACKSLVGLIMIFMYRSMDPALYEKIQDKKGSLTMVYEMVLTNYEKNSFVDVFAICGNNVIGYSSSKKIDTAYAENHTQKILQHNGYPVTVKIFTDEKKFLERMDYLNQRADSLRADIPFTPNETYPDLSREDLIKHTILAISL